MKISVVVLTTLPLLAQGPYRGWPAAGGGNDAIRYSKLTQINRSNVNQLAEAWRYDTGDAFPGSEIQCNPVVADGLLFATSPRLRVFALDAATGEPKWTFDPFAGQKMSGSFRHRGVMYAGGVVYVTARNWLHALDGRTGKPVTTFGNNGRVDLREGLGRPPESINISVTSPGVIYKDLIILGSLTSEDLPSAPGDIRAFHRLTGRQQWAFHTMPHPGEFGYETWPEDGWKYLGGANSWPGLALDEKRGIVYAPTGSAAFDFYGANRKGDNLFANSLLALEAATGKRIWHFQTVRHDVWDRDLPSAPSLVTLNRNGKRIDAVAQISKAGFVWLFDRVSGKPVFPIEERPVPASDVPGELLAKTQPFPTAPPPFSRQQVTEDMLTNRTPEVHRLVLERFRKIRSGPQFTPPSLEGTIVFPGFDGGGEWGGPAFDPETGRLYVNANEMAWILRLVPRPVGTRRSTGKTLYIRNCANCHREDRAGSPPAFPSLLNLDPQKTEQQLAATIRDGVGRMPGFAHVGETAVTAIARYIRTGEEIESAVDRRDARPMDLPYTHDGYNKFLDPDGYPAIAPPWGTLSAIDLNRGEIAWQIPFGEFPELAAKGMKNTGTENYGGPVVTAGGLLFIGATNHDRKFRVFDKQNGALLWETTLPAGGNATPAVYEAKGRQFIVIAAGGGKSGAPSGGTYVAFAIPQQSKNATSTRR